MDALAGSQQIINRQNAVNPEAEAVKRNAREVLCKRYIHHLRNHGQLRPDDWLNISLSVGDQYPKYVVTMDEFRKDAIEGVVHLYITDFLLKEAL